MPVSQRRSLVDSADSKLSVGSQCRLLGISRSSYYYRSAEPQQADLNLMQLMDQLHLSDPTMGTRRLKDQLKDHNVLVGRYKVRRKMQQMRMKTIYCRPRTTCVDKISYKYPYLLRNLPITHPNHVWSLDITYIPMRRGYLYLVAIMDVYSRYILNWSLSNTMEASWVVNTLEEAINQYGKPEIINSDQGSQFTSEEYVSYVKSLKTIQISMDGKGRALDNVYIERFWRTLKYEKLYLNVPQNGHETELACSNFIYHYNELRKHSTIDRTPSGLYFDRPDKKQLIPTKQWMLVPPGPVEGAGKLTSIETIH